MSIYRKLRKAPPDDVHDFPARRVRFAPAPAAGDEGASEWSVQRRAKPLDVLLAATAHWCASLPQDVQPRVLCARFPRIANALAAGWRDREVTVRYFEDLLGDRRGGRKGFPLEVLAELHRLRDFYEEPAPAPGDPWFCGT